MEIWIKIKGYENYEVSNIGNIKNILSGNILKPNLRCRGYARVYLYNKSGRKQFQVHRLVALAFIPNPDNKKTVNHKNGIHDDNRVDNLEWNTVSENILHAFRELGKKPANPTKRFGIDNVNSKKIKQFSLNGEFLKDWNSISDVERELGYYNSNIVKCLKGHIHSAYGFNRVYYDI